MAVNARFLVLDVFGSIALGIGLAEKFGRHGLIVPPALQFEHYDVALLAVGGIFMAVGALVFFNSARDIGDGPS